MKLQLLDKNDNNKYLTIGLMSGTSADGIDAVLVEIEGNYTSTKVKQIEYTTIPFSDEVRERILKVVKGDFGGTQEICLMNFLIGKLSADACEEVCKLANVKLSDIDFVGSHGQTVFHAPLPQEYLGETIQSTLQIGEASMIVKRLGCPVVSDFRVRDIADGGYGAPLVPYTEFLMYRSENETIALQNIGGIGNITLLPKNCELSEVCAFDTGPGNMVMDTLTAKLTNGKSRFDDKGLFASQGSVNTELLNFMLDDEYLKIAPPKTTGREYFGDEYVKRLLQKSEELGISLLDTLSTATRFTAECIAVGINDFCNPKPDTLIIGGGGSYNPTLLSHIKDCLPNVKVITNEEIGLSSDAKEAVAFAVLANETLHGNTNNAPSATGASESVVMGKISL